jgi:hypothetical protein
MTMRIRSEMRSVWTLFASSLALAVFAAWPIATAHADDQKSDFALFDQEGATPDVSVQCGAAKAGGHEPAPFVMYITMSNRSAIGGVSGLVHVKYHDGDLVDYAIPVDTTVQITLAGGGTPGTDDIIEVTGTGGAKLVGQVSLMTQNGVKPKVLLGGKSFCTTTPFGQSPPFPL